MSKTDYTKTKFNEYISLILEKYKLQYGENQPRCNIVSGKLDFHLHQADIGLNRRNETFTDISRNLTDLHVFEALYCIFNDKLSNTYQIDLEETILRFIFFLRINPDTPYTTKCKFDFMWMVLLDLHNPKRFSNGLKPIDGFDPKTIL